MGKLFALLALFRKGAEISDVEKWKSHQISGNVFGGFILALVAVLKVFGYELPVDEDTALLIGGGIVALVNVLLTAATSKRAGILPAKAEPSGASDSAVAQDVPIVEAKAVQVVPSSSIRDDVDYYSGG